MAEKYEERARKLQSLIKILDEEKELNNINLIRMISAFKNKELIKADGDLFLTVDSLITINNYITGSRNMQLRQVNVRPAFYFNKQYMDFAKIEPELYKVVDQFNDRKIAPRTFCDIFLDKIHPFADGNGRTCKLLFEDKIQISWEMFIYYFFKNYAAFFTNISKHKNY